MKRMRYFTGLGACNFDLHRQAVIYLSASIIKNKWINLVCSDHRVLLETRLLSDHMGSFSDHMGALLHDQEKKTNARKLWAKKSWRGKGSYIFQPQTLCSFSHRCAGLSYEWI